MAITDPTLIAASSDGTRRKQRKPGQSQRRADNRASHRPNSRLTRMQTWSYQVGSLASNATAESTATAQSLLQLNNQLNSVSGVSIDEESTNLITYQTAYEAAARVIRPFKRCSQ